MEAPVAIKIIGKNLDRQVKKEKITEDEKAAILGRISTATDLSAAAGADLVVEAVFESYDVKKEIFIKLDEVCGPDTILASNTSSISITKIGGAHCKPARAWASGLGSRHDPCVWQNRSGRMRIAAPSRGCRIGPRRR